jgi:hypothetical protein
MKAAVNLSPAMRQGRRQFSLMEQKIQMNMKAKPLREKMTLGSI